MFDNQKHWFETTSLNSMNHVLESSPGKIGKLINQHFMVVNPFEIPDRLTSSGRKLFADVWKRGNGGIVRLITFGSAADWVVHVEYLWPFEPEFLSGDEIHITLPLRDFLVNTMPMEDMEAIEEDLEIEFMGETAANDDVY
ncbi:MAG: hypothetical protein HOG41_21600 [Gammaproteobacteria bacterium]|jgi:hypothetical protein|nr:hypothetical protein [Gammaproteobacteria bacterium]MBT4087463.1 hypothetical protein [Deltaproteobacteria bacterium]MBT4860705.1 hypothetical protein [Gammaproteobacteria bacterium]MBT7206457.1 hypothetical protein [Gammaproteobacteria bacterium]